MLEGLSFYKLIFNDKGEVIDGILEYMNLSTAETRFIFYYTVPSKIQNKESELNKNH
jgi:hypothetical protein